MFILDLWILENVGALLRRRVLLLGILVRDTSRGTFFSIFRPSDRICENIDEMQATARSLFP
jgi:hypothetical protein